MPDECHILNRLETHHLYQLAFFFPTKENHALHLTTELLAQHIRLVITVVWNNAAVSMGCLVYHLGDNIRVFVRKFSDHALGLSLGMTIAMMPLQSRAFKLLAVSHLSASGFSFRHTRPAAESGHNSLFCCLDRYFTVSETSMQQNRFKSSNVGGTVR